MSFNPLTDFSNSTLFTPTAGDRVAKLKTVNNQYFVRLVTTFQEALACGAVLCVSGDDWVIIGAQAALALHTVGLLPCSFQPAPRVSHDSRGLGLPALPLRVDPAYIVKGESGLTVTFAGVFTRAHAVFGWSRMEGNPFVKAPTLLNVHTTSSKNLQNSLNGSAKLAVNPMRAVPAIVEIAALNHPFGVVDLFKRPEVQAMLDDWEDGEEFRAEATAAIIKLPNVSPPSPLLHVWTPSAHYFGAGFTAETRGLRRLRQGDNYSTYANFPAVPAAVAEWAGTVEWARDFNLMKPNPSLNEYNTNASVKTVSTLGASLDSVGISNAQWGAPASCYAYATPAGTKVALTQYSVRTGSGNVATSINENPYDTLGKSHGAELDIVLPWIDCCDPLHSIYVMDGSYNIPALFASVNTAAATCIGMVGSELILNKAVRPALVNVGVPELLSGSPALSVLGGTFVGCYYGTDFARLPTTGVNISSASLIQVSPPALSVSFELQYPNTTGMTADEKEAAERAAEAAFAAWKRPGLTSLKTDRTPERWIYSMMDAFGDLMTSYYTKVEQLAKEKYD